MYTLSLIGYSVILIYMIYCIFKCRCIPQSISASIYVLDERNKWIFRLVMWAVGFMIVPQMITVASAFGYEFLSYLTVVGLIGVGVDPLDKEKKNVIHYISAIITGVSSQILVFLINPLLLLTWIPYIIYTLYMEDGSKNMFIGEISMFGNMSMLCLL